MVDREDVVGVRELQHLLFFGAEEIMNPLTIGMRAKSGFSM
jgi:hypothetical protein